MLQTKKGTCARQGLGPHPLAPRSTAFTQRHAKNPELQGGKRGRGERVGCAAQMAPARGERPGIHTKAAGFNYQLASPGRARGCAVNLPLFPCPLPSLDFASPPDAFGAASALAGSIAAFRQCRAMLPRGTGQIQGCLHPLTPGFARMRTPSSSSLCREKQPGPASARGTTETPASTGKLGTDCNTLRIPQPDSASWGQEEKNSF